MAVCCDWDTVIACFRDELICGDLQRICCSNFRFKIDEITDGEKDELIFGTMLHLLQSIRSCCSFEYQLPAHREYHSDLKCDLAV
ncbi:unnamed protein product [Larinioides sclopetarius]|uniref:Uncharacterized protein n=1 Tax=Larinioides sclopetarius TaxID=280406 RepID=A0AAV2AHL9_9ARAC